MLFSMVAMALMIAASATSGCSASRSGSGGDGGGGGTDPCTGDMHRCTGSSWQACVNGVFTDKMTCPAACDPGLGCVACAPNTTFCDGNTVRDCDVNGMPAGARVTCVASSCIAGTCTDPCEKAAAEFSYLGCDYFPTVTVNSLLTKNAHFAVAIANPSTDPVDVDIKRNNSTLAHVTVAGGGLQTVMLPWVTELKDATASGLVASGSFKLSSVTPVTVYQFNPLEYQTMQGCKMGDLNCFTFTNDASLLLPISTLTGHYIVIARPTWMRRDTYQNGGFSNYVKKPGFFSVVGADRTRTTVTVKFSAATMAGANGSIKAYKKGQTDTFSLQQTDVLQIFSDAPATCTPTTSDTGTDANGQSITYGYCDLSMNYDLTGTEISADKKVAVFSGHDCTFVPYNRWACDHLEEEMLPLESWGKDYLASHTKRTPASIPDLWRVVSATDGNMISFDPSSAHAPVMLDRGQWVDFTSRGDFEAIGSGAFALAQFMVGEDYAGFGSSGMNPGDPSMSLSVPIEQYRSSYIFLTPASYQLNYVNVTAPAGTQVMLDGMPIDPMKFTAIGAGKYVNAKLDVAAGTHRIEAGQPFGIQVYGLAPYTSYMYPGGLDVKQINVQ